MMDLPESMYLNYVERRKADHARLKSALAGANPADDFKVIGHQLRGNASSFGFMDLVPIAERMEQLAKDPAQLTTNGQTVVDEFGAWIQAAEKELASRQNNPEMSHH